MGPGKLNWRRLFASPSAGILGVAALALAVRGFGILSLPIFWDEAIYLHWAKDIWEQRTRAALLIPISDDGKQPLFMWLAGGAAFFFSDPLLAGRAVSALAGVFSTLGVYLAGCWLVDRRAGLLAALLYAVTPFTLLFDRMALADGLLNAAGVWGFCMAVFVATRVHDFRAASLAGVALGVALGVAIWTKMTALFMLAFPALCAVLLFRRKNIAPRALGFSVGYAVFGAFALMLAMMPSAYRLVEKTEHFVIPSGRLSSLPVDVWISHWATYWSWVEAYLPAPMWWLALVAMGWGLLRRWRLTLLLLGCWAALTLPTILTAQKLFTSRYVMPGVFPVLILIAMMLMSAWSAMPGVWVRWVGYRYFRPVTAVGVLLLLALLVPSLAFDYQLATKPESAPLAATDMDEYVTGWPSGYGFMEAAELLKSRAAEITGQGQPILVLTHQFHGLPYDGLEVYAGHMRDVFHYGDMHLFKDAEGFLPAWLPHQVPALVLGEQGPDDLDALERAVPQLKRIGFFPKPGGRYAFRVYEIDLRGMEPQPPQGGQ